MSIPGGSNPLLLTSAAGGAGGGYEISRSLRFNSSDSAYLSRTPSSAGNRKTWTFSWWMKRSALSTSAYYTILDALGSGSGTSNINIPDSNSGNGVLEITEYIGAYNYRLVTTQVFRDPSAWYHCVVAFDTTQATAADRIKLYINGTQVTTFSTATYPSQNLDGGINSTNAHNIGRNVSVASRFWDGYLAEIHFIDGQALTPSSFAETNATTGQWVPKAYSGTYGTNGFHLPFSDNSTAAALGTDTSGAGNNWTVNNISVAAGSGNDSLVDTPTSYGTDTGAGGEVRGNYCTWNPLLKAGGDQTYTNGNLEINTGSVGAGRVVGTVGVSSGKWYWEVVKTGGAGGQLVGIVAASENILSEPGSTANGYSYYSSGQKYNNGSLSAYAASWTTNDVIGLALDLNAGTLVFYKNGVSQGTAFTGISGTFVPAVSDDNSGSGNNTLAVANFGQRPFAYTAPSGFKALCDTNLPAPVVAKPSEVMDVALYTGNGIMQTISGLGFSPDLVWAKKRNGTTYHNLVDIVRGANKELYSNDTLAETTPVTPGLTGFNSDGFALGANSGWNALNDTYVAWTWDAGSSTVTNTQGSITSQVRANASAGFSVITFDATSAGGAAVTIGHGLGVTPGFFVVKARDTAGTNWYAWHRNLSNTAQNRLFLNGTNAEAGNTSIWNNTAPSSTLLSIGGDVHDNDNCVVYAWAPVAGYSSFGSYTGNGSADGPFVYTGFRPRWVMMKCSSVGGSSSNWVVHDTARDTFNVMKSILLPNLSSAELTTSASDGYYVDALSNGFKVRTTNGNWNANAATYIYAAFAESPFQYARAR